MTFVSIPYRTAKNTDSRAQVFEAEGVSIPYRTAKNFLEWSMWASRKVVSIPYRTAKNQHSNKNPIVEKQSFNSL